MRTWRVELTKQGSFFDPRIHAPDECSGEIIEVVEVDKTIPTLQIQMNPVRQEMIETIKRLRKAIEMEACLWDQITHVDLKDDCIGESEAEEHAKGLRSHLMSLETEFYDQKRWLEIHKLADELIATKDGRILLAVYKSPDARTEQDRRDLIKMLHQWAVAEDKKDYFPWTPKDWPT